MADRLKVLRFVVSVLTKEMALELVGGAALGAVVGELFKAILDLGKRAIKFNPVLIDISSKLNAITPLVKQIDELNDYLDYPKEETEKLRDLMNEGSGCFSSAAMLNWGILII